MAQGRNTLNLITIKVAAALLWQTVVCSLMVEHLALLRATQVVMRSTLRQTNDKCGSKIGYFCNPASRGTLQAQQLHYVDRQNLQLQKRR
jgi:hypothetical protein